MLLERSFNVGHIFDTPLVRAFSFWRLPDPEAARDGILNILNDAIERTRKVGLRLALENEHACNIGTGAEARWYLDRLSSIAINKLYMRAGISLE
jgi:L-ribulose-5-phosphate 3-epimerase